MKNFSNRVIFERSCKSLIAISRPINYYQPFSIRKEKTIFRGVNLGIKSDTEARKPQKPAFCACFVRGGRKNSVPCVWDASGKMNIHF